MVENNRPDETPSNQSEEQELGHEIAVRFGGEEFAANLAERAQLGNALLANRGGAGTHVDGGLKLVIGQRKIPPLVLVETDLRCWLHKCFLTVGGSFPNAVGRTGAKFARGEIRPLGCRESGLQLGVI